MQAIQYVRWSSERQSRGSSLSRQTSAVETFCAEHGWKIVEQIVDPGASGWSGENMLLGELSTLHKRLRRDGGHGLVLVCETLDRLSRFRPMSVIRFFDSMLSTGVAIALADKAMIITADSLENQTEQLRELVADSERARREGDVRSARSRGAWVAIRDGQPVKMERDGTIAAITPALWGSVIMGTDVTVTAKGRAWSYEASELEDWVAVGAKVLKDDTIGIIRRKVHTSGTAPAWLTLSPCRRAFGRNETKITTLKLIFERYAASVSYRDIARELNKSGVETWRGGNGWQTSALKTLISCRSVLGEYQHQSRATGELVGDPDPVYFPQVIADELFQSANDSRHKKMMDGRGKEVAHRNLLAKLATCGVCGGRMRYNRKTDRTGDPRGRTYYQCASYDLRRGCTENKMHHGNPIEDALLDSLLSLAMDDQHFRNDDAVGELAARLAGEKRGLEEVAAKISRVANTMAMVDDPRPLISGYNALVEDAERRKAMIADTEVALSGARGAVAPNEHIRRVSEIRADMYADEEAKGLEARATVMRALNDLLNDVTFYPDGRVSANVREGLRTIIIRPDRQIWNFDFKHPAREYSGSDPALAKYVRRNDIARFGKSPV